MNSNINISVNDREELIYLLTEAAQFEHTVMCTYLYAMWSLKKDENDGITAEEKEAIDRWRASIRKVALEEMLHLALVNNLVAAFGATPCYSRPDFPVIQGYFPSALDFHLAPFNEETMQHFVFIERPECIDVKDGASFTHESHYTRVVSTDLLTPTSREYSSQGHLYHGIAQAIRCLADELGEEGLFIGHGEAQLSSAEFPLPGLFKIGGVETAMKAIEEIVSQGEGAPAHREDSHFARFDAVLREYRALKEARPDFEAAFPAAVNPVLTELADDRHTTRVTNSVARHMVDLGNSVYGLMLQTLAQVSAPVPLPSGLRQGLSDVSCQLMKYTTVIGEAAARMPICDSKPGINAGLSFAVPKSFGQYVQANAAEMANCLRDLHSEFEEHFTLVTEPGQESDELQPAPPVPDDVPANVDADNVASSDEIEISFDLERCIHSRRCVLNAPTVFLANVKGPWLHPETDTVEHLVHVAQSCPSGAITYRRLDGGPAEAAPLVNVINLRQNGPYAFHATLSIDEQPPMYRATLCRCGQSRNKPFCDNSHIEADFEATGEPVTIPSEPLTERGGELHVAPLKDGPLKVRGSMEICSGTGRTINRPHYAKLCRCGGSANKPYCDDTHLRIGFRSGN